MLRVSCSSQRTVVMSPMVNDIKMTNNTPFQNYCQKALLKLTEADVEKFKATTREDERIKMIYDYAKTIPINVAKNGKNLKLSQGEKEKGNKLFAAKKYDDALNSYNIGIIACPQDTDEGKELLTILISNRSATYFEQQEYRKVFDDIDYLLAIGSYPQRLHYKIWFRKAKCYDALQNERYADETYDLAISSLKHAGLDAKALAKKVEEIENSRKNKSKKTAKNQEIIPVSNSDLFVGGNKEFVAAHKDVYFDFDPLLGRFARAVENIETGVIIVEENPHCVVLSSENTLLNCQHCCSSTQQPIACANCGHVVFCSLNCERQANSTYHKFECAIQPILFQIGASVNCLMALRMVSQRNLNFFLQKKKLLRDFLKDGCKKLPIKSPTYRSDDYITAFFLCRNEHMRKKGELVHYSSMAIYLLRLLKYANYFGGGNDDTLTDDEAFIGSLILRHLQILQFNSHEVSEIRGCSGVNVDGIETYYQSESIGAGLYPTLALFNHSCDPSIVRYNIGSRMVVRTIKPVKAGEIIYENYGPIYTTMVSEARRAALRDRYWFECYCGPCQEEWPLFENMDPNQIKIGCQTENCPFEFTLYKDDFCPYLQCDYCNSITKIFPCLRGLSELAILLPRAENLFSLGQNREAMKIFMTSLDILYKHSKPPCPDMVKVQQRLRTLFVHLGNKQCGYVQNF